MRVAAYQAPLLAAGSMDAIGLIRTRVEWCETEGVAILCCPEAILGGLADYDADPTRFAIAAGAGRLDSVLAPLASDTVTTIVGFTELADGGRLYNSAAVFQRGWVAGVYRKLHPAIHRSVYEAGGEVPVFRVGELTFGIVICNDSNFSDRRNSWPLRAPRPSLSPRTTVSLRQGPAPSLSLRRGRLTSPGRSRTACGSSAPTSPAGTASWCPYGSSAIVDPNGVVVQSAREWSDDLIVAEIDTGQSS